MLLFIFVGFIAGFVLCLRFVRHSRRALIWGLLLGVVPLAIMLGPGNAPVQGIGSVLNFAFFALGPLMLIPFIMSGAALGVAGGTAVLWVGHGRARWVGWAAGLALVGFTAGLTLLPVAQREVAKRQADKDRDARATAIMLADFKGTLASHQVAFPASPRLYLFDDCGKGQQVGFPGCPTSLTNPVTILTRQKDVLLHEPRDSIVFLAISVGAVEPDCHLDDFCLTQEKIDRWCGVLRPDQADSIWCRAAPPMRFLIETDAAAAASASTSEREEPELAARYADTPLGSGQVDCFYDPDPAKTEQQGAACKLSFNLALVSLGSKRRSRCWAQRF